MRDTVHHPQLLALWEQLEHHPNLPDGVTLALLGPIWQAARLTAISEVLNRVEAIENVPGPVSPSDPASDRIAAQVDALAATSRQIGFQEGTLAVRDAIVQILDVETADGQRTRH